MIDNLVANKLAVAFPKSFINSDLEFIAHKEANEWFRLEDCNNEFDVKCKVLEWLSRGAYKTCPFNSNVKNERFHNFMLNGVNDFLGTDFTESDIEEIYTYLGNRCNHEKTVRFIESNYDMSILKGGEKEWLVKIA